MNSSEREALGRVRTIDITTRGRKSGRPARIEIWWFRFEDRFIITRTPGARDWLANLTEHPQLTAHVGCRDLPATASPVTDPAFRRRFFKASETSWYRGQVDVERLVAEAPMVEVSLSDRG